MIQRLLILCLFTFSYSYASAQVVLNEFSASNYDSFTDNYGQNEDWIELYNVGIDPVDLEGYHLSDRIGNPDKWAFPAGIVIEPHSFLRIWASGRDVVIGNNIHTSFKIKQTSNKEDIVFADPAGLILDSNEIPSTTKAGYSWARESDGIGAWKISNAPSPLGANQGTIDGYAERPDIKPIAGFYNNELQVSIEVNDPKVTVYYTMDGSTPTILDNIYTDPFYIDETTVIRAIGFHEEDTYEESFIETNTYFIDEVHTVKVVSMVGDDLPELLDGGSFESKFGSFEYFNEDQEKVDEAVGDYNKHGNDSWAYPQRGVDYICRDEYGYDADIDDEIFTVSDRGDFQRLILKAAANDNYPFQNGSAHIRDAYVHTLSQIAGLEMDERSYEPCVVYLNGEYWGVYELREKVDDPDFTKYYYDQDKYNIDFIKTWGGTWEEYGSWDDWYDLKDFIDNNDMGDPVNYAYVDERFNLLSLIDYVILHSYNVSSDWLNWNTAWWRGNDPDGEAKKWKYALWDEDATYGHYINYSGVPDQSPFADPCNPEEIADWVDFEGHIGAFKKLFESDDFLALYINRYADLNNTYFNCDFSIYLLDSLIANIEPEMERHIDKWGGTVSEWKENVQEMKDFILDRCTIIDEAIVDCYEDEGITGPYEVVIDVQPAGAGNVKANTLVGLNYPWDATYFGGIELNLEAIAIGNNEFYGWEVKYNDFDPDPAAENIQLELSSNDTIIAYFEPYLPCQGPNELIVDASPGGVQLEWLGAETMVGYNVFYRKLGETDWNVHATIENETFLDDLEPCEVYEFKVRTVCNKIVSEFSEFTFESYCSTATEEDLALLGVESLKANPNPFGSYIDIEILGSETGAMQIDLYNMQGQKVKNLYVGTITTGINSLRFDALDDLTSGSYFLRFSNASSSRSMLLIKT